MGDELIKLGDAALAPAAGWKLTSNSDEIATRLRVEFPNGYGVSIIRGKYTYGGADGLFEGAVLDDGKITYATPITDDVVGNMTAEEAIGFIQKVAALPPRLRQ